MIVVTKIPSEKKSKAKVAVSELNLRKAAKRLLGGALVSTEVSYIQRELGARATQEELEAKIVAARRTPWASIVGPE